MGMSAFGVEDTRFEVSKASPAPNTYNLGHRPPDQKPGGHYYGPSNEVMGRPSAAAQRRGNRVAASQRVTAPVRRANAGARSAVTGPGGVSDNLRGYKAADAMRRGGRNVAGRADAAGRLTAARAGRLGRRFGGGSGGWADNVGGAVGGAGRHARSSITGAGGLTDNVAGLAGRGAKVLRKIPKGGIAGIGVGAGAAAGAGGYAAYRNRNRDS